MTDHDQELALAFDSQAPKFECARVQSDPIALEHLFRAAELRDFSFITTTPLT
jgi:hypothetical protein